MPSTKGRYKFKASKLHIPISVYKILIATAEEEFNLKTHHTEFELSDGPILLLFLTDHLHSDVTID
jgi:hypothetical protein